ncbi:MAG: tRNA (adenosine(37)-N6)-dimethylallyltransferase MiaA [Flavobacteriaceae bacterium]|nr:tRNA (adenosine(37)-N6)-dimethylallyltransferase MiaA [Flavobacteriaceae bacterium]
MTNFKQKTLVVLVGATAVGKTDTSIAVAKHFDTEIISADSRQFFKEMNIGTAVPEPEQLATVKHHFIQHLSIQDYYSSYDFEQDAIALAMQLFEEKDVVVLTGGSMLYIDAICKGIDDIPTISAEIREQIERDYQEKGLAYLQERLKILDPVFYEEVDLQNPKRLLHAVEVCVQAGKPYSQLRTNTAKKRPFQILKIGLDRDRAELYERINLRVDLMLKAGLEEEVRNLYPLRGLNALKTVGYKEFFGYFDGKYDRDEAIRLVKRNSRHYAKRQLSWFRRDAEIQWFHPDNVVAVNGYIEQFLNK